MGKKYCKGKKTTKFVEGKSGKNLIVERKVSHYSTPACVPPTTCNCETKFMPYGMVWYVTCVCLDVFIPLLDTYKF